VFSAGSFASVVQPEEELEKAPPGRSRMVPQDITWVFLNFEVESQVGGCAEFTVRLPRRAALGGETRINIEVATRALSR
jgi:hypothetical protein